jgi:pimeloyl-ACP methyl ester carboxylesterase
VEQIIEIADYKIFTKIEGEGRLILLLHSYWGSQLLFDHLACELSKNCKVIRIDLPGHGFSGAPPAGFRFDSFAEVLNSLLIKLHIHEKLSVVGHSMGGYAAMAFASRFPERTESLILMHSPVKEADIQSIKLRNREADLLIKGKKELMLQVTISSNFAPENAGRLNDEIALVGMTALHVSLEGALRTIEAMNHRRNYLNTLQCAKYPILIIVGKYDKVYDAEGQIEDAAQIPRAEILMLNHSGHMGFLEEPDKVLLRMKQFLGY